MRYARWVADAFTGDLGTSFRTGNPVFSDLLARFLVTLELAVPALAAAVAIALLSGVLSAVHRNSAIDHASRLGALAGASMPSYWLAYLLIIVFSVRLGLLPVAGRGDWRHLVLPTLTLALGAAPSLTRLTRSSTLEALGEDYVRTARALGYPQRVVVVRHALRNALLPLVTVAGLRFGHLLAGAVIVETVFAWPGLGKHIVDAIYDRDYPTIQGFVVFVGTVFVLLNLLVDLAYTALDPRIRLTGSGRGS